MPCRHEAHHHHHPPPPLAPTKALPEVGDTVRQRFEDGQWHKGTVRAARGSKN
jgi:hypothetical protein